MSWTYKTWSTSAGTVEIDGEPIEMVKMYQVKDRWIPPWHFNKEKKLWEPVQGQEKPPMENKNGFDSTATT